MLESLVMEVSAVSPFNRQTPYNLPLLYGSGYTIGPSEFDHTGPLTNFKNLHI